MPLQERDAERENPLRHADLIRDVPASISSILFSGGEDSPDQITAVYGDRVPAAGMSLQKFKELCVAPPST